MANLSSITNISAAPQIVASGVLAAGQVDIGLSAAFKPNMYPSAQIGAVLVYVDGQLFMRNVGNATASPSADGNYQEVDSGLGTSALIRLNVADPNNDRSYVVLANGFYVTQADETVQAQIETLQTQQDNMALTLAEVAGVEASTLYTPLNDATRATFAAQFNTLQSNAALKNVSNTFTAPQLIPGRTDGATPSSPNLGQKITGTRFTGALASNTRFKGAEIPLEAGTWIVTMVLQAYQTSAGATTRVLFEIADSTGGLNQRAIADTSASPSSNADIASTLTAIVTLSAPATIYGNIYVVVSSGTFSANAHSIVPVAIRIA